MNDSEVQYSSSAVERAMKVQEVILRAMAGKLRWWEAAEIIGLSDRTMRRWRERYEEHGYDGLFHRQKSKPHLRQKKQTKASDSHLVSHNNPTVVEPAY